MEQLFNSCIYRIVIFGLWCSMISADIIFRDEETLIENSPCKAIDNLWGVCTRASLCPKLKLDISMQKICSFDGDEAIVCCVRSSELACNDYAINNGELYKVPPRSFFIGGLRAKPREHPHMAAIGWSQGSSVSWKCGGSLITDSFLITAAHCTKTGGISPDIVRAGVTNLVEENPDPIPVDYNITEIIVQPDYKSSATYHDIALMKIAMVTKLLDSRGLRPICLWPQIFPSSAELLAMGFGTTSFGGPQSNELFVGSLKYVDQEDCVKAFSQNLYRRLSKGIIKEQLCAQDPDGTKDTCQGDSGGPLQTSGGSLFRKKYLVGITSFGEGCLGSTPGVYTRIYFYLDWIENIVWPHFK